jgi:ATP-binding cassette, subfamily B, bacterial PglK
MLVAAILEVAGIGMIPAFVAIVAAPDRVMGIEFLMPIFNYLNIEDAGGLLIWGSIILVFIFILKSLYKILYAYFESRFIYNRRYRIGHRLMSAYMQAPYTFHLSRNTAELLRNTTGEINVISNTILTNILQMAKEVLMTVSIFVFLLVVEPLITIFIFVLSGLGAGSFILLTQKKMKMYGEEEQERRKLMIKAVYQGLNGIKEARVLNREKEFIEKFRNEAFKSTRLMAWIKFIQQIPKPVVETTAVIGMLSISAFLVWQGRPMSSIIPILTLFAMATVRLMPSVQGISKKYTNLRYNLVSLNPVYDDLRELENYISDFNDDRNKKEKLNLSNEIELQNVTFVYPGSNEKAVDNVNLKIRKG